MLKNYFKIALRNLLRQKGYMLINICGLAIGIAACLIVYAFIRHEWTFDRFHERSQQIYRVIQHEREMTREAHSFAETPAPLGPTLAAAHPQVEQFARVFVNTTLVRREQNIFDERLHFVDPALMSIFTFPLVSGDPHQALSDPSSVVITESMAKKYFGADNPIGKTISIQFGSSFQDLVVSGIAEDVPPNSSVRFDFLLSFERIKDVVRPRALELWGIIIVETFVLISPTASPAELEPQFTQTALAHYNQVFEEDLVRLFLQPITDIHLNPAYEGGSEPASNPNYSYILGSIALLVLLIACINFMILSVGRSASRAKEVGMRKVLGAWRVQLQRQFWGEAILLSFFATLLGIALAEIFLPQFNKLAGMRLAFEYDVFTLAALVLITLFVGVVAGSYPALVFSRFSPIESLRGKLQTSRKNYLRQGLVVTQFAISVSLIAATMIMLDQISYLRTKNLGYDKEQVVIVQPNTTAEESMRILEVYRQNLAQHPEVLSVAGSSTTFGRQWAKAGYTASDGVYREFYGVIIDYDYIKTMAFEFVAGRDFSRAITSDAREAIIVNETLAKEYGWENPLGKRLPSVNFPPHQVVGVVKDFNFQSLHEPVKPLLMALGREPLAGGIENIDGGSIRGMNWYSVRLRRGDISNALSLLEAKWREVAPALPFQYSFLDEDLGRQYRNEERMSEIAGYSAALAIFIACLGLLGLAAFTAAQRTKEIGIRKVMGASVSGIVALLSKDFVRLVLIANLIGWPLAYFAMQKWLQDFAYRVDIGVAAFAVTAAAALAIAMFTVSFQAIKAALTNPVDALRYE
jgi:putative ABC transport system permease protein